jgi:hypothetical protein
MSASTDVPVTVTPEAEACIAERGKRIAVEQMIAFLRSMRPPLGTIRVELEPAYDSDEETILLIAVERMGGSGPESRRRAWWDWVTVAFPMEEMMDIAIDLRRLEDDF